MTEDLFTPPTPGSKESPPNRKETIYLPQRKVPSFIKKLGWVANVEVERADGTRYKDRYLLGRGTKEEAIEARKVLFTRLLLEGAQWKKNKRVEKIDKTPKVEHADDFLQPFFVQQKKWRVCIDGEVVGTSYSKMEARRIRDQHIERCSLKRCFTCKRRAVIVERNRLRKRMVIHEEDDCPNKVRLTSKLTSLNAKIEAWNSYYRKRKGYG